MNEKIYMLYEYTKNNCYLRMASIYKDKVEKLRNELIINYIKNNDINSETPENIYFESYYNKFKIVTVFDGVGTNISYSV